MKLVDATNSKFVHLNNGVGSSPITNIKIYVYLAELVDATDLKFVHLNNGVGSSPIINNIRFLA